MTEPTLDILILDIDGVLNTREDLLQEVEITKVCMDELERIVETTGCKIVISSSWRCLGKKHIVRMFNHALGRVGSAVRAIVGMTPNRLKNSDLRGDEIQAWLDQNPNVGKIVILDDDVDMGHLIPHLVRTDPAVGLTPEIADEVISRFQN